MDRARDWLLGNERADPVLSWAEFESYFKYGNNVYSFGLNQTLPGEKEEKADGSWASFIHLFRSNPIIFACMDRRLKLFSEARFQYRQMRSGRPGDLFGDSELAIIEQPWPNATTGDLLARAIADADLAGNFYAIRTPDRHIHRLRPDWTWIVLGQRGHASLPEVLGYVYQPDGPYGGTEPVTLDVREVAHWAPVPDPGFAFRGMSWLTPVIREVAADNAATTHKLNYFENGATVNLAIKTDFTTATKLKEYVELFREKHRGVDKAYETLFLMAGQDPVTVGSTLEQVQFKVTQGAGETRIAAAAGVPPIIVGLSEGLAAATYSNYGQARRAFADLTMRPLWRNFAASVATIINVPTGAELWYDDRDIPFLAEDLKDAAEIRQMHASTMKSLIDGGYEPDAVVDAVTSGDLKRLRGKHTGWYSVQLQPGPEKQPEMQLITPGGNGTSPLALPVGEE